MDIKGPSGFKMPTMPAVSRPVQAPITEKAQSQAPVLPKPQDTISKDLQQKMHSLSNLTKILSGSTLASDPVLSSNIMKQLTEIALPLLGDNKFTSKENDKKIQKDKSGLEDKSSENKEGKNTTDSSSLKSQSGIMAKQGFSSSAERSKMMQRGLTAGSSLFESPSNIQLARQAEEAPGGPPSQEKVKNAVKNAATAIWDILKKTKDEDGKEDVTAGILVLLLNIHSAYTSEHSDRVMDLTMSLAAELGIDDEQQLENLKNAAFFIDIGQYGPDNLSYLEKQDGEISEQVNDIKDTIKKSSDLHDIGKMRIPSSILNKNGKLTDEEFAIIKTHPIIGEEIVKPFKELHGAIPGIRGHHEKWDGRGYPDGKKGLEVPLQARIIAICDTFDAMTEDRPYRKALTTDEAVRELLKCSGTQFDPTLVPSFVYALAKKGEINIKLYEDDIKRLEREFNFTAKRK